MRIPDETRNQLSEKFAVLFPHLDERQRRLLMGTEARLLGMVASALSLGRPRSARRRSAMAYSSWNPERSRWGGSGVPAEDVNGLPTVCRVRR